MASDQSRFGPPDTLGDKQREDTLDVLREALRWRLTTTRWAAVEVAVETVTSALRAGDVATLRAAVYDLQAAGPVRATGFGDTPVVEPPEPVREEINELIHTLDGRAAAGE